MSGTPAIEFEGRRFGVQRIEGEGGKQGREEGRSGADQDGLTVGGRVRAIPNVAEPSVDASHAAIGTDP